MAPMRRRASSQPSRGFTLIELLVVIAIIAILTAILLPVFASVRESSRQGVAMSNMKDIQQKMEQFKLDNHRYPDVLFGYYYPAPAGSPPSTMKSALGMAQNAGKTAAGIPIASIYFPGLYPAYIKDPEVFTDPNNTVNTSDANKDTGQLTTSLIAPCNATNDAALSGGASACGGTTLPTAGSVVSTTRNFYLADAYDTSPLVTGTNTVSATSIVRYQLARENTLAPGATADADYNYQLRWQNPPAGTLITVTTYHVKNADKVLAIFESGAVKKITGHDFAALEGPGGSTFWQVDNWPDNIKP